ncbi:DUF4336 domain-containing protein [Reyranella sp.]|uniref:DUF4336 domain-containing protein n=1 Tax=Reyranella sp. TaxID=1929291 RepID=UPI001204D764|nr:DUF4336 domain-containing protein [Reyranella sp.]TAJ86578.1 MAG: DUF4336 domain-containing protein [Reyranella sp.]
MTSDDTEATYPPLNTLKPVAPDLWIVDGPIIHFGVLPGFKMPFPTRMTVIRVGGDLFIHSPTPLLPTLQAEIEAAGRVRWIVGPNRIHYWWIPEWKTAFTGAEVWLAPRIEEQAKGHIAPGFLTLDREAGYPWDETIATLPVGGSFMTEVVFFHRPTRTLVLADLIENFESHKVGSLALRWLTKLGGVAAPDGQTPRDLRATFAKRRPEMKAAVEKMIAWNPDRMIIAHGRWFETAGTSELRRSFRWLLDD